MIPKKVKNLVHSFLRRNNYELIKYPYGDLAKRMELINKYKIKTIFDVGANIGEFAESMQLCGFIGRIVSFEPRKEAFNELLKKTQLTTDWQCVNIGLGDTDSTAVINVAGNKTSSSLLEMNKLHTDIKPHSKYCGTEEILLKRLDTIVFDYVKPSEEIYLKIDTQGFEKHVIDGAQNSLSNIRLIQLEMSLAELYKGSMLIFDMIPYLEKKGYFLCSIERGFHDKVTGRLLQVDGLFFRF